MMISPETFYDDHLKGKSEREILAVIRGLKQKIGRLKKIMEHPDDQCMMHPAYDVQISCNRMYLERAKQALVEVGGTYTPSQAELRAEKFNATLPYIFKVEFSITSFFAGFEDKTYLIDGDKVTTTVSRASYTMPTEPLEYEDEEMDKDTLIEGLADLHIGEWRREYDPKRFDIALCDGTSWYLNIYFTNGIRPVKIDGCNDYPYNFARLLELFNIQLFSMDDLKKSTDENTNQEKWEDSESLILPGFTDEEMELVKKALTEVVTRRVEKVKSLPDAPVPLSDEFNQKTIHEKWDEGGITILPPKEKLSKEEIKEKLRDPNLPSDEKNELLELLYEGIEVK